MRFVDMVKNVFLYLIKKRWIIISSPKFIFGIVGLLIVLPLFRPGFIFLLDFVAVPKNFFPTDWKDYQFVLNLIKWFFNLFLSASLIQKMYFMLPFFLGGYGMYKLLPNQFSVWARYFGGFFYIFNPFVYSRSLVGQVVIAYSLFPWFVISIKRLVHDPSYKNSLKVGLWWTLLLVLDMRYGVMASIFIVAIIFFSLFQKGTWKFLGKGFLFICALIFLLNLNWVIPILRGNGSVSESLQSFSRIDVDSFSTRADAQHGVLWNTAAMYGFWGDEEHRYLSQKLFVSYWFYLFFVFFAFVLWGVLISVKKSFSRKKNSLFFEWWIVFPLILTGFVAFFLAVGVSYEPFKPVVLWFYNNVPFFKGFREPQKFVALLVFVYAIFSAIGVDDLLSRIKRIESSKFLWLKYCAPGLFLLVPLAYSPGLLWGAHGQIRPAHYPQSWFQTDQFLENDKEDFRVLFLPWHQYMPFSFARTVIANPAEKFFHKPTIAGDNMEFGRIYTQSVRAESKYIEQEILQKKEQFIENGNNSEALSLGNALNYLNIKYLILAQESDFESYAFVPNSKDMQLVYDSQELRVYQNLKWSGN